MKETINKMFRDVDRRSERSLRMRMRMRMNRDKMFFLNKQANPVRMMRR